MGEENKYGKMELYMKDIGLIIKCMDLEDFFTQQVIIIKVSGKMINLMDMVYNYFIQGIYEHFTGVIYKGNWKE
jgi:hypothetical protein